MRHIEVEQGSREWLLHRYGIPTASEFHNLITPAKGERTKGEKSKAYIAELIGERHAKQIALASFPEDVEFQVNFIEGMLNGTKTEAMAYGNAMEPEAVSAYEFLSGNTATKAGFILNDEGTAGASLDRFVGDEGGVEIKCPFSFGVHVDYCLTRKIEIDKRPQLQGQLWLSGRKWIDIVSYYPGAITVIVRAERDEEYIQKLAEYHAEFTAQLETAWQEWQNMQPR